MWGRASHVLDLVSNTELHDTLTTLPAYLLADLSRHARTHPSIHVYLILSGAVFYPRSSVYDRASLARAWSFRLFLAVGLILSYVLQSGSSGIPWRNRSCSF